jgi:hypothetical protein
VYAVAEKVFIDGAKVVDRQELASEPDSDFLLGQPAMGALK